MVRRYYGSARWGGWLFLATVIDIATRQLVGWSINTFSSVQGSQYSSSACALVRTKQPNRDRLALMSFDDEVDAIRIANDTPFGLIAAIFTADLDGAMRVSRAIRAGVVSGQQLQPRLRRHTRSAASGTAGYGRERAAETLPEYGYSKTIRLPTGVGSLARWSPADDVFS